MLKTIIVEVLAISLFLFPAIVQSPSNLPLQELEGTLILIQGNSLVTSHSGALQNDLERQLWEVADKYGLEYDLLYNLAVCESNLIHENRWGDRKLSYGLFQWQEKSWDLYNKKFGLNLDRYKLEDQVEMTALVIKNGDQHNWKNCWRKFKVESAK